MHLLKDIKFFLPIFILLCLPACTSVPEVLRDLDAIHREPVVLSYQDEESRMGRFMEYASNVEEDGELEEVEDPVEYCLDCIQDLEEADFDSQVDRSVAVCTLSRTARRSPSRLVRASALKTLRNLFTLEEAKGFVRIRSGLDEQEFKEKAEELGAFYAGRGEGGTLNKAEKEACLLLIAHFSGLGDMRAETASMILNDLVIRFAPQEEDEQIRSAWEDTAQHLNIQLLYLTIFHTLRDPQEVVRETALHALFAFPLATIRRDLADLLDRNFYFNSREMDKYPLHRILISRKLRVRVETPSDLGIRLITHMGAGLKSAHAGVSSHAVKIFQKITGIENDDPRFWDKWRAEYVMKHADEIKDEK